MRSVRRRASADVIYNNLIKLTLNIKHIMKHLKTLFLAAVAAMPLCSYAQHGLVGFANYADLGINGTTGGGSGEVVHVTTRADLERYAKAAQPYVIIIDADMTGGGVNDQKDYVTITSNKTIIGGGDGATLDGLGFDVNGHSNIIIRNLTIKRAKPDGIAFRDSHHVWIDHCDLSDSDDGALDFTIGSSYMTVSWTRFHDHDKTSTCNSGTQHFEDYGKQRVTYHHCRFENTVQRNPRIGYGLGHVFNTYYTGQSSYCVGVHTEAKVTVENCYFENTKQPLEQQYTTNPIEPAYGEIMGVGNKYVGVSGNTTGSGTGFDPTPYYDYKFALDAVDDVPGLDQNVGPVAGVEDDPVPFPGDGAIGVGVDTELWCGKTATASAFDYYIGTQPGALELYDAATTVLQAGTTYYWTAVPQGSGAPAADVETYRFTTSAEKAANPLPADGDEHAELREATVELSACTPLRLKWDKAFGAAVYRVYLSDDGRIDEGDLIGETESTYMMTEGLRCGKEYVWRVDAVTEGGAVTTGDVWTFKSDIAYAAIGRSELEDGVLWGRTFMSDPTGYFKASGSMVTMGEAGPGCITFTWNDKAATYNIVTTYYDENDGQGWYGLSVNDERVDEWKATADNEQLMKHLTRNIALAPGDELRIDFYTQNKEQSRADCIDVSESSSSGITEVEVDDRPDDTRIYTVDGRYVGRDASRLPRGIYIMNGRKVVLGNR